MDTDTVHVDLAENNPEYCANGILTGGEERMWDDVRIFSPPITKCMLLFSHESGRLSRSPHYMHVICSIMQDLSSDVHTFGICSPSLFHKNMLKISSPACLPLVFLLVTAEALQRWLTGGGTHHLFRSPCRVLEGQLQATVSAWCRWRRWALSSRHGLICTLKPSVDALNQNCQRYKEVPRASRMSHVSILGSSLIISLLLSVRDCEAQRLSKMVSLPSA